MPTCEINYVWNADGSVSFAGIIPPSAPIVTPIPPTQTLKQAAESLLASRLATSSDPLMFDKAADQLHTIRPSCMIAKSPIINLVGTEYQDYLQLTATDYLCVWHDASQWMRCAGIQYGREGKIIAQQDKTGLDFQVRRIANPFPATPAAYAKALPAGFVVEPGTPVYRIGSAKKVYVDSFVSESGGVFTVKTTGMDLDDSGGPAFIEADGVLVVLGQARQQTKFTGYRNLSGYSLREGSRLFTEVNRVSKLEVADLSKYKAK